MRNSNAHLLSVPSDPHALLRRAIVGVLDTTLLNLKESNFTPEEATRYRSHDTFFKNVWFQELRSNRGLIKIADPFYGLFRECTQYLNALGFFDHCQAQLAADLETLVAEMSPKDRRHFLKEQLAHSEKNSKERLSDTLNMLGELKVTFDAFLRVEEFKNYWAEFIKLQSDADTLLATLGWISAPKKKARGKRASKNT